MTLRLLAFLSLVTLLLAGCDWMPGKPSREDVYKSPAQVTDFDTLYTESCAACHSLNAEVPAAARPLNEPRFLAFIGADTLKAITAEGIPGTAMPPGLQSKGGALTKAQITILVDGIIKRTPQALSETTNLPTYAVPLGHPQAGQKVYTEYCASCHGSDGQGGPQGGSIIDPDYLALVSNQSLRNTVVLGRPEFGMPDSEHSSTGKPMSDAAIADVVAWMASYRVESSPELKEAETGNTP